MLFQVENRRDARRTHCGVLEFIADEGMAYLPYWMMQVGSAVRSTQCAAQCAGIWREQRQQQQA